MNHIEIIKHLNEAGYEVAYVGGCVRDFFLKMNNISDFDIATNATYDEIIEVFKNTGAKVKLEGKDFLVAFVDGIEVATYREDIYADNYKCTHAKPVKSLEEDLARRDLTINSMAFKVDNTTDAFLRLENLHTNEDLFKEFTKAAKYVGYSPNSAFTFVDPFNGREDIKNGKIRFTGNAHNRIMEDPVRMLRACRFLAIMDRSQFESQTFRMITFLNNRIEKVKPERIRIEVIKAMKAKNAGNFFRALCNTGLLYYVFHDMVQTVNHYGGRYHNEPIFEHCVMACDNITTDNYLLKIAAFLHDIGKPIASLLNSNGSFRGHDKYGQELAINALKRLKFSNNEIDYVTNLIGMHMINWDEDSVDKTVRKIMAKCQEKNIKIEDLAHLIIADHDANMTKTAHDASVFNNLMLMVERVKNDKPAFSIKDLTVNGNDVMKILNIQPSKKVGRVLEVLFNIVMDHPQKNNRDQLIDLIKTLDLSHVDK